VHESQKKAPTGSTPGGGALPNEQHLSTTADAGPSMSLVAEPGPSTPRGRVVHVATPRKGGNSLRMANHSVGETGPRSQGCTSLSG